LARKISNWVTDDAYQILEELERDTGMKQYRLLNEIIRFVGARRNEFLATVAVFRGPRTARIDIGEARASVSIKPEATQ